MGYPDYLSTGKEGVAEGIWDGKEVCSVPSSREREAASR
jgi:hypothetical protein